MLIRHLTRPNDVGKLILRLALGAILLFHGIFKSAPALDSLRDAAWQSAAFELMARRAKDRLGRPELLQDLHGFASAEAGYQLQGEPVEFVFLGKGGG